MTKKSEQKEQRDNSETQEAPLDFHQEATPEEFLEEEETAEEAEEILELMGFKLGDEEYAVDIMRVKEITLPFELTPIPRAPSYILGILSLRGNIIPVFDAKKKIGLPDTGRTEKTRIIVIKNEDEEVGMLVDAITSAAQISLRSIEPPPPILKGVEAEYIEGVGRYMDRMMIIMNIDEIIKVGELQ